MVDLIFNKYNVLCHICGLKPKKGDFSKKGVVSKNLKWKSCFVEMFNRQKVLRERIFEYIIYCMHIIRRHIFYLLDYGSFCWKSCGRAGIRIRIKLGKNLSDDLFLEKPKNYVWRRFLVFFCKASPKEERYITRLPSCQIAIESPTQAFTMHGHVWHNIKILILIHISFIKKDRNVTQKHSHNAIIISNFNVITSWKFVAAICFINNVCKRQFIYKFANKVSRQIS